jgi:ketosteroid isomerase-like protein
VYSNLATLLRQIGALKKDIKERATWPTKLSVVREPGKESNRSVVDTFYSLWKDGKIEEMAELFAPQAIVSDRALVKAYKTREEIIALLKSEYENHKKLRFQHEKMSAAGEYVISPATKRGVVELAVKPDAPPLAKNVAIPVLHLFKFENGKIASLDVYYDEFKLFEQFGVPAHMAMKFVNQRDLGASAGVNAKQTTDKDDTKSTDNETQKTKEKKSSGQVESIRDLNTPKE